MSPEKRVLEDASSEQEVKKLKEGDVIAPGVNETASNGIENGTASEKSKVESESETSAESEITEKPEDAESTSVTEGSSGPTKKTICEESGRLVLVGTTNWNFVGRKQQQISPSQLHYLPKRIKEFENIKIAHVISHASSTHHMVITDTGEVYMLGRNEKAQLGVGDDEERAGFVQIDELKDVVIVGGAVGKNHTLFLTEDGEVYACGDNKSGQCGIGTNTPQVLVPKKIKFKEGKVTKVACGADFSVLLTQSGDLFSFGLPEYGQLGHNSDGKYFITSSKMSFEFETSPRRIQLFVESAKGSHPTPVRDVRVVDVACGNNHTVCIDSKKRIFSWGFGGYGRLGHSEQKDEMIPRLIKFFDRPNGSVHQVYCGATYTLAQSDLGVFLWGKTKRTGEANMYPKPVQDLYGWNVRAVGCSVTSIVLAADESVIAWGPSPTYGELGLGEGMKSSTTPKEVKALEGAHVLKVTCSQGTTLMVVRDETDQDKSVLSKLKEISI